MEAYVVSFKGNRKECFINPDNLNIRRGDYVVVQADRGEDYGLVVSQLKPHEFNAKSDLRKILRVGDSHDNERMAFNREKEEETFNECLGLIAKHGLAMKLVDVEYQFDCNKITFYFTAEKRVDFRELVKELAAIYRTRIELRQIGVRDEAKMVDGYGKCGRRQCCSAWMPEFSTITTQMARFQNLPLYPEKLSGNCGRLLCCLKYEMEFYEEVCPLYPAVGARCMTRKGKGVVTKVDIFKEQVVIGLEEGGELRMKLAELKRAERRGHFRLLGKPTKEAAAEGGRERLQP